MRQTLAVSVTFAIFGDGSRLLQETDSVKTTQMLQHWVITPGLVRVTACGKHGCQPVGMNSPGLSALAVWAGGGILGGVGRADIQFLSYYNVHRFGS